MRKTQDEVVSCSAPRSSGLDAYDEITMALNRLSQANELLQEYAVQLPNRTDDTSKICDRLLFLGDTIRRYVEDIDRAADQIPTEQAAIT